MTFRQLKVLIRGLPPDAAVWRADPDLAGWTLTDHLLASLIEVVDAAGYRALLPYLKKGKPPPEPVKVPRPGAAPPKRPRGTSVAELVALGAEVSHAGGS